MRRILVSTAAIAALSAIFVTAQLTPASARDDVYQLDIAQAMASPAAHEKLDGTVKFYFGNSRHPAVLRKFGDYVTNQKTSAFGKSDRTACTWVLMSALVRLQKRAHDLGANAVININSYYKRNKVSSESQIPCHAGFLIAGIALKGDFVRVAGQ